MDRLGFHIQLGMLQVISEMISHSPQPITWLVLANKMKQQPNNNTNN